MNRSELALANFVTNYEFNPTCRPVILGVGTGLRAAPTLRLSEIYSEAPDGLVLRLENASSRAVGMY